MILKKGSSCALFWSPYRYLRASLRAELASNSYRLCGLCACYKKWAPLFKFSYTCRIMLVQAQQVQISEMGFCWCCWQRCVVCKELRCALQVTGMRIDLNRTAPGGVRNWDVPIFEMTALFGRCFFLSSNNFNLLCQLGGWDIRDGGWLCSTWRPFSLQPPLVPLTPQLH